MTLKLSVIKQFPGTLGELLDQSQTGDIIELEGLESQDIEILADGRILVSEDDGNFLLIGCDGQQTSLGKHEAEEALITPDGRVFIRRDNQFLLITSSGGEYLPRTCDCDDWYINDRDQLITHRGEEFLVVLLDGNERSLGTYAHDSKMMYNNGIIINRNGEFFSISLDGSVDSLGTHEFEEWGICYNTIVITHDEKIWAITPSGGERLLGPMATDFWTPTLAGVLLFEEPEKTLLLVIKPEK